MSLLDVVPFASFTGAMEPLTLDHLRAGGKAALARALAALERRPADAANLALLDDAFAAPRAHVIGLTGPPGVGKSTLTGALIARYRSAGETVGVIAVDPSSKRSGGALLGDRVRLAVKGEDDGVFIRSMAARDRLGGLAEQSIAAMVLMRSLFDKVLIETVGVGQSETEISVAADSVVFCVQPGSGDSLQFMKAGIVEIPHIAVVTKADMGPPAQRALSDLTGALSLSSAGGGWQTCCLTVSASDGKGMEALIEALHEHFAWLQSESRLTQQRSAQTEAWLRQAIRERFGSHGLGRLKAGDLADQAAPFSQLIEISARLS